MIPDGLGFNHSSFLGFFTAELAIAQPNDDYTDNYFIKFSIIFLGQAPHRGIHLHSPGSMHNARWMSKVL